MLSREYQTTYCLKEVTPNDLPEYQKVAEIREALVEVGYDRSTQTQDDEICQIYLLYFGAEPVATVRVKYIPNVSYRIGGLAVDRRSQKRNHGLEIMRQVLTQILSKLQFGEEIYMVAQPPVFAFHAKLGFHPTGSFFSHRGAMVKKLVYMPEFFQKL